MDPKRPAVQKLQACAQSEAWIHAMRSGDWETAWKISDDVLRQRIGTAPSSLPRHQQSVWTGESLHGKRVLVRCYHGLGDTIQFVRFAPALRRIARSVTIWAQPQLIPLLGTVAGIDLLMPLHDGSPDLKRDVDIELMELPHALRTTLSVLPAEVPYLHVPKAIRAQADPRPSVGVVWQSGGWDPRRSVPPQLMQRLVELEDIGWRVLQRGPALAAWPPNRALIPRIDTILEEAAELRSLDLLITVDTLSAHLAGALGVRTWTLLPAEADWRWMDGREDTPWYPTMRLFRQPRPGDWGTVLETVRMALQRLVAGM
jgi:hypothetical protein